MKFLSSFTTKRWENLCIRIVKVQSVVLVKCFLNTPSDLSVTLKSYEYVAKNVQH